MKTKAAFIIYIAAIISVVCGNALGKYSGGTGEPNNPYQIASKADLLALAADTNDYSKCFILTADVNMEGQVFTKAIIAPDTNSVTNFQGTAFTGTFDGNDFKITNFTIDGGSNQYLGLFGRIDLRGSVKNLGLENSTVSGSRDIGGLAGSSAGGLVGSLLGGIISNCYSTGNVSGSSQYFGGLVGYSFNSGINSCYSRGWVSGTSNVGGLVGYKDGGSVLGSFWNTQTSGQLSSSGGTGLSTLQMKQQGSFTGWDFTTVWAICEGTNYPRLLWQIPAADWVCPDGVNKEDLGYFAGRWLESDCGSSNNCGGTDIDVSDTVDSADFALFASYWLND